jgi:hypothetical protein
MFDLNQQIARWKRDFAANGTCSTDELEELESHLREEIATLLAAGLAHEEAFAKSVARIGEPDAVCSEFAKNERRSFGDLLAIRGNTVMVVLVGLAAVAIGIAVGIQRGDALLGAHLSSVTFAYVVPFLLAVVGTYAIFRTAMVQFGHIQFRDQLAGHCRVLFSMVALLCAAGAILGAVWTERHWGRFWGWDPKETGALAVVTCALVLFVLVTRYKPTSVRLGQASLMMSLVTCAAWFGPAVYLETIGPAGIVLVAVALIAQLTILSISFVLPKQRLPAC